MRNKFIATIYQGVQTTTKKFIKFSKASSWCRKTAGLLSADGALIAMTDELIGVRHVWDLDAATGKEHMLARLTAKQRS